MVKVFVLIAPGFEEIEAVTIIDILRRASIQVTIVGLERDWIKGSHDITIKPDVYYKNINPDIYDALILPGGQPGTNNLKSDSVILSWIKSFHASGKLLAAICAAPTVFHKAGIADGYKLTSYPSEKSVFNPKFYSEDNVVIDKNMVTSRGVGTAIEFSLTLVSILLNSNIAADLKERVLYK